MINRIVLCILMFAISGCATTTITPSKYFESSHVNDIVLTKTSKTDVLTYFGEPGKKSKKTIDGNLHERYFYWYSKGICPDSIVKGLTIELKNNYVNGYHFLSEFKDNYTDFDESKVDNIIVHKSMKKDLIKLYGNPHSRFLLPSMIISSNVIGAENAVEAWRYGNISGFTTKTIFIFFDENNYVIKLIKDIPTEKEKKESPCKKA